MKELKLRSPEWIDAWNKLFDTGIAIRSVLLELNDKSARCLMHLLYTHGRGLEVHHISYDFRMSSSYSEHLSVRPVVAALGDNFGLGYAASVFPIMVQPVPHLVLLDGSINGGIAQKLATNHPLVMPFYGMALTDVMRHSQGAKDTSDHWVTCKVRFSTFLNQQLMKTKRDLVGEEIYSEPRTRADTDADIDECGH